MKEIYYTYNNEALASCVILAILQKIGSIDIARSCLILPLIFDEKTIRYLQNMEGQDCLMKIVKDNPNLFTSFNKRYLSLLPITINSLIILSKNNQILHQIYLLKRELKWTD